MENMIDGFFSEYKKKNQIKKYRRIIYIYSIANLTKIEELERK